MRAIFLAGAICLATGSIAAAADPEIVVYKGMCEASGAVAVPEGSFGERFLVVDNEDNILRIYRVGHTDEKPAQLDVSEELGIVPPPGEDPDDYDIDLEAATWLNHQPVLIGSLGRSKKGNLRPARQKFFSVDVAVEGDQVTIGKVTGQSDKLLPALTKLGDEDLNAAIDLMTKKVKDLAPKKQGINLEGMTVAADGTSLFLGLRNPIPKGMALLVRLRNPEAVLSGAEPEFDPPIRLDLGGHGIRSIEYSEAGGAYFIAAGAKDSGGAFDIYRWVEGESPKPIHNAAATLADQKKFQPEAMLIDPDGTRIHLFSDDEDDCDMNDKTFRSMILPIE